MNEGVIAKSDTVVCILTGHELKDPDATVKYHTGIDMKAGTLIDYTIKIYGIRVHWRTLISDYNPPHYFIDEQLKGPYAFWHHRHEFVSTTDGTIIRDTVTYALPFGIIGRLARALFVKIQLQQIFDFRTAAIIAIFGEK